MNPPRRLVLLILVVFGCWSGFTYYLYYMALRNDVESTRELALVEARMAYEKDVTYRRWAARMGGLYAEITETLLPNPYLDVPDRDPVTESGRKLTLINPAYMTRMVHGVMHEDAGLKAHITSLEPIRPANAPTAWEAKALESFKRGVGEFHELAVDDGREVMRFMRPMVTEEPCLKCHAKQGYKLGEIRGGISVTVPLDKYAQSLASTARGTAIRYSGIFLAGSGLILTMFLLLVRHEQHRNAAELALRESEERIRESEALFRAVFENAGDAIYLTDIKGRLLGVNNEALRQTGFSRQEFSGMSVPDLDAAYTPEAFEEFSRHMAEDRTTSFETEHRRKDGGVFPVEVRVAYFELGPEPRLIGVARDITGRKQAEREMTASLKEKDILLREIHHRVKNNLQIISSLLSIQEQGLNNPEAKAALLEGRGRIASMALIHEQLYHSRDFSEIDLKAYLEQFVPRLVATYMAGRDVSLVMELPDVSLSLDKAIPFGLIMNELVTNAIKHGLRDRSVGEVRVRLSLDGGHLEATVADDGAGLPPDFDLAGANTLGLQIVTLLTEQLHGRLTVESGPGAVFRVRIPIGQPGA
ncbi:histidine kinase dimerization/phosphoacceptor domain -containing protein [Fundidesulfovibrio soli]|uniref:histidine kinase dimerization/phosphoacceptor domain -containing protein n=1 Tax=Fundidesulfovibrio soli TaxID=2922716 RepID=UPI001FAE8EDE|nr:histidine kinase dimerization/phosphoacceptor domain -containing protein [Fundidesulfovibrio soli]